MTRRLLTCVAVTVLVSAMTAHALTIGPLNPGAESNSDDWFQGASAPVSWTAISETGGVAGSKAFEIGATQTGVGADWRCAQFDLGPAANGAAPVDFSFEYLIAGTVPGGQNVRIDLRFWDNGGNFAGERNVFIGADSGDSNMAGFKLYSLTGVAVPAQAVTADIRPSLNLFTSWSAGSVYLDNFAVTTIPEPLSVSLFGLAAAGILVRRRKA